MPNIIRIRKLVEETNLDEIIFPVDKVTYLDDAHRIGIEDLKEYILSGYTGGSSTGGTNGTSGIDGVDGTSGSSPCTEVISNVIKIVVNSNPCGLDGILECCNLAGSIDCSA